MFGPGVSTMPRQIRANGGKQGVLGTWHSKDFS